MVLYCESTVFFCKAAEVRFASYWIFSVTRQYRRETSASCTTYQNVPSPLSSTQPADRRSWGRLCWNILPNQRLLLGSRHDQTRRRTQIRSTTTVRLLPESSSATTLHQWSVRTPVHTGHYPLFLSYKISVTVWYRVVHCITVRMTSVLG